MSREKIALDWKELGFGYIETDYNVRCEYRDGRWSDLTVSDDDHINLHMAATCLHYGQEAFEGLKAFEGKDGKIRIFRIEENAKRMIRTAEYMQMQAPSVDKFVEAVKLVVDKNRRFVPPYGTGASLYIRPLLIGTSPQVGVKSSKDYMFIAFVTPVGPYYKEGFKPIKVIVDRDHDRAAVRGTGHIKIGGNYGASLISGEWAHSLGYPSVLYLDPKEKRYIDECGAANFFAIKDKKYITPQSTSVLPSITNMSLQIIAKDLGLDVEFRPVEYSELEGFEEAGSCGTAAVISPVGVIYDPDESKSFTFGDPSQAGPWTTKLYERLRAIQFGDIDDTNNWITTI